MLDERGSRPGGRAPVAISFGAATLRRADSGGFLVSEVAFPPALALPRHHHERACLTVMLDGVFSERIGERDLGCVRGTILAKPPYEPHSDRFGVGGSRQLIIEPDQRRLSEICALGSLFRGITHTQDMLAAAQAARLVDELDTPDSLTPLAVEGFTLELLALLARASGPADAPRPPTWLRRVRDLLHEDLHRAHSLAELATLANVHPVYLARAFRRFYGRSIAAYARSLRLEWAASRIAHSDDPLGVIAVRAGFFDQSHFTRWFKRHTGMTPSQYRSARREA
jgi:AraC family transcriptional regulator